MSLTNEQKEIVNSNKNLFVSANPGTGKSYTAAYRVEKYIKEDKIFPNNIYVFSFSRTAAFEIREKLKNLISTEQYNLIHISTIHSFAYQVINDNLEKFGIKQFRVKGDNYLLGLMKVFFEDKKSNEIKNILKRYSYARKLQESYEDHLSKEEIRVLKNIFTWMEKKNIFLFDDLLVKGLSFLKANPEILDKYQRKMKVIVLDESQDTAKILLDYIDIFITEKTKITVFGDLKQSIYIYNGSDPQSLINFSNKHNLEVKSLNKTFRFGQNLADFSWKVVEKMNLIEDKYKNMTNSEKENTDISLYNNVGYLGVSEICNSINSLIKKGIEQDKIAILYRFNRQSLPFQQELAKRGIKFFVSGNSFLQRKEIKVLLSIIYLMDDFDWEEFKNLTSNLGIGIDTGIIDSIYQFLGDISEVNIFDVLEMIKISKIVGLGKIRKQNLNEILDKFNKVKEIILEENNERLFEKITNIFEFENLSFMNGINKEGLSEYEERMDFIRYFDDMYLSSNMKDPIKFIESLQLDKVDDEEDEKSRKEKKVYLGTYHSSKGMTIPYLFLILDRLYAYSDTDQEIQEEHYVLYVGITRASNSLSIYSFDNSVNLQYNFLFEENSLIKNLENKDIQQNFIENNFIYKDMNLLKSPIKISSHKIIRETEKAVLLDFNGKIDSMWCPKSCLGKDNNNNFYIEKWLADQNNVQ